jgi:sulfite exporter TauE/SafE
MDTEVAIAGALFCFAFAIGAVPILVMGIVGAVQEIRRIRRLRSGK